MTIFCERLNSLVEESINTNYGMTKEKIANDVGITASALSNYLSETRTPRTDTLRMLAKYFKVSVDYLIGISDIPSADISIQQICERTGLSPEDIKQESKLCPFKRETFGRPTFANKGFRTQMTEHFQPCLKERCMAYKDGVCLRMEVKK